MTDNLSGEQVTYTYDQLNRLTQAMTNDAWGLSFSYDGFGNLTQQTRVQGTTPPSMSVTVDPGTNRITTAGYGYDANGNVTQTPDGMTYSYDGANRMVSNGSAYDPRNQRVWDGTYLYYYGVGGELIGKYQALWGYITTVNGVAYTTVLLQGGQTNLYFNGRAIRLQGHGSYVMTDRLGSVRVNGNGQRMNYYPYGAEVGTETAEGRVKFGTYTRDSAGVDYAEQRYYGVGTGKFFTADPGGMRSADSSDAGSWNRYAYVGGDPINFGDPSGRIRISCDDSNADSIYDGSCNASSDQWFDSCGGFNLLDNLNPNPACYASVGLYLAVLEGPAESPYTPKITLRQVDSCALPDGTGLNPGDWTLGVKYQVLVDGKPVYGTNALNSMGISIYETVTKTSGNIDNTGGKWCPPGATCGGDPIDSHGTFWDLLGGNGTANQTFMMNGQALDVSFSGVSGTQTVLKNTYNSKRRRVSVGNGALKGTDASRECGGKNGDPTAR